MARRLRSALPLLCLAMAGCTPEPFDRPGTWRATGANDQNLRAMVVDQTHLERGAAAPTERGAAGSNAVTRLLIERRRPLPVVRTSTIGGGAPPQAADQPLAGLGVGAMGGSAGP